jgi:hypothetical protein
MNVKRDTLLMTLLVQSVARIEPLVALRYDEMAEMGSNNFLPEVG